MLGRDLVAAGYFFLADGDSVHHVARWDGVRWSDFGSGLGAAAKCIASRGSDLYVGGDFIVAGEKDSYYFAHWREGPSGVEQAGSDGGTIVLASYPNPFRSTLRIGLRLPGRVPVRVEVFDPLGRPVAVVADEELEAGEHEIRWSPGLTPCGNYLLRVVVGNTVLTRVLVRDG
jgi:hypothetical protein